MANQLPPFADMSAVVAHLRSINKKNTLLYAYNGIGKTRLSMAFQDAGKNGTERDTLYFNAFTEDLFSWDNDLENDSQRVLRMNRNSSFFSGIQEQDMENKIRPLLHRYADFNFLIDYQNWTVNFMREVLVDRTVQNVEYIKISRGEENIFIWCFFLAVAQLAIDKQPGYTWVKYLYIDDPISSLDDHNAIAVASHLAQMLKKEGNEVKTIISSHHTLFFNVMFNELKNGVKYFLSKGPNHGSYILTDTSDTPYFYHVSLLQDLRRAAESGNLYTYHFNILRNVLEKTANFHGFKNFSSCIKQLDDDPEGVVYARIINILSHGNYSLFEPTEMLPENKEYFRRILNDFMNNYRFNPELFPEAVAQTA
ncbi:AAA family ATPase [Solitalea lacus]|uniref:AAA family ATPase n=1 Tax=Solitalea lacus TaxID=2911172 RepID=UPI001EDA5186|nr:AAA family ATPase [Solitalea lacus]UKJ09192.1 AAA family ATPase [Solitalea lacus]